MIRTLQRRMDRLESIVWPNLIAQAEEWDAFRKDCIDSIQLAREIVGKPLLGKDEIESLPFEDFNQLIAVVHGHNLDALRHIRLSIPEEICDDPE